MIEIILLGIVVIGIIILVYQNLKKNEKKLNNEEEIEKLTTINSGIDDLKSRIISSVQSRVLGQLQHLGFCRSMSFQIC